MAKKADGEKKLSKRKIVDMILQEHGDIGPKEIIQIMKDQYNEEMNAQMASSYKSQILSGKAGGKGKKRGRPKGSKSARSGSSGVSLDVNDVVAVQQLINRMGAGNLQAIIDALTAK